MKKLLVGLWFSTGVRSTEMKFRFYMKCCYREWRCRINTEFSVSAPVDFTHSGISPGLPEEPVMNPCSPLKGCGRDVCPASGC